MAMQEDLTALVLADAGFSAVAGDRLNWLIRDKDAGLPTVTLQVISAQPDYHLKGVSGLQQSRVQADVWAASYTECVAVSRAFKAAVIAVDEAGDFGSIHALTIDSERDLTDTTQPDILFRTSIDLMIDHY